MTAAFVFDLIIGIVIAAAILGVAFYFIFRYLARRNFEEWKTKELSKEIERALNAQRSVVKGQISEKLFPMIAERFGDIADFRFIGDPIDYVVFQGLSSAGSGNSLNIKFIEVKTGSSKLNLSEKLVKDAVENKRVSWEEIHL